MTTLGLPTEMFLVFVATVLAGSLGAIHYVVVHIIMGRPFAEILPPVLDKPEGIGTSPGAEGGGTGGDEPSGDDDGRGSTHG